MTEQSTTFGDLLRQAREAAGLSRAQLAERAGLDVSHVYRIEVGGRRASRESALTMADVVGLRGEPLNQWLLAAGYAPMPFTSSLRGAVRTRGGARPPATRARPLSAPELSHWKRLQALGLEEGRLARLLRAMESAQPIDPHRVARLVSMAFTRLAEMLETPVHTALIPAAGGQHRLLAPNVVQRLLLRAVKEVVEAGITHVVLILPPGMDDALFAPLKDALDVSVVPAIELRARTQAVPNGLGDAILVAEEAVGGEPFAVVLPDDVLELRSSRSRRTRELPAMIKALAQIDGGCLIAAAPVLKTRMARGGVIVLGAKEVAPRVFPVRDLVEKPEPSHPIYRQSSVFGIVGRYILQPEVFPALRRLQAKYPHHVELTDALADLRRQGQDIYAFEFDAPRQDLGELLDQADALLGDGRDKKV